MLRVVSLFVLIGLALAKNEMYDGHAVYETTVRDVNQVQDLNYVTTTLDLDVWSYALPGRPGFVLVPRLQRAQFEDELFQRGLEYKVESDNVKDLVDLEERLHAEASKKSGPSKSSTLTFDRILTLEEVYTFLDELARDHHELVTVVDGGNSFEGKPVKYLRISTTNFQDTSKPIVIIQSLLHAREWVTLPATLYAIKRLVIEVTEPDLVEDIDWVIIPVANPDGYAHSHEVARFWRKNRNNSFNSTCMGVDLNRNFNINWGGTGSSNNICSETFRGDGPFSEPEARIVRDIVATFSDRTELFLDIHSTGSMILFGWGNGTIHTNGLILNLVGVRMAQAIDAVKMDFNINYIVGNVAHVLYQAAGIAGDYPFTHGVPLCYTYELPRYRFGTGLNAFLVDPDFIEQAGFETWEGMKAGAKYVRDGFRK